MKPRDPDSPFSRQDIATRAESLWRQRGCPQGCDEEIWLEAERQLWLPLGFERNEGDHLTLNDEPKLSTDF
jgi:hypothetical protein